MKKSDHKFTVPEDFKDVRLDVFLQNELSLTRSQIKNKIKTFEILLNGVHAKPSNKLKENDLIEIFFNTGLYLEEADKNAQLKQKDIDLDIIFEDEQIIVVNKPPGLVTYPGAGKEEVSLVHALYDKLPKKASSVSHRPGVVHRLDKDTQGLIVLAKTTESHIALSKQFKDKTAKRTYKALCYGRFKEKKGTIESFLGRNPKNRKKIKSLPEGKKAITHFEVTYENELTEVKLELDTGRTHQIRVHLSEMSHPIINDKIYGNSKRIKEIKSSTLRKKITQSENLALVAIELKLTHPTTGDDLVFKTPWPKSFKDIVKNNE